MVWCMCKFPQPKEIAIFAIVGHYSVRIAQTDIGLDQFLELTPNYGHQIFGNYDLVSCMQYIDGRALFIPQIPTDRICIYVECVGPCVYVVCCVFYICPPSWNQL